MSFLADINWVAVAAVGSSLLLPLAICGIALFSHYSAHRRSRAYGPHMAERIQRAIARGPDGVADLLIILRTRPDAATLLAIVRALRQIGPAGASAASAITAACQPRLVRRLPELENEIREALRFWNSVTNRADSGRTSTNLKGAGHE